MISSDRQRPGAGDRGELEDKLAEVIRAIGVLKARREAAEDLVRSETAGPIARLREDNASLAGAIAVLEFERRNDDERARQLRARALTEGWARAGLVFGWTVGLASGALLFDAHPVQAGLALGALVAASLLAWRGR